MRHKQVTDRDIEKLREAYGRDAGIEPAHLNMNQTGRFLSHLLMVLIDCMMDLHDTLEDIGGRDRDGESWRNG